MQRSDHTHVLLGRDVFREAVLARSNGKCVFCKLDAVDAHHILERRLWSDGGYYVDNGAAVCEKHHIECEKTSITVEQVRDAAGIRNPIIPDHLYQDQIYDKWGNPVLDDGTRLRGELFNDSGVQKILAIGGVLDKFRTWVKYPRTYHLPWTACMSKDDRKVDNMTTFEGREVVVTLKMDGENTSMYSDHIHARSLDSRGGEDRSWVKRFHAQIQGDIPVGWRVCGENLYAKHSIYYTRLMAYFMGFSVWDNHNRCLSWDETQEYFELLGITSVPVLYRGIYDEKIVKSLWKDSDECQNEGYVLRVADSFAMQDFKSHVAKFVRKNHVAENRHWRHQRLIKNVLSANYNGELMEAVPYWD